MLTDRRECGEEEQGEGEAEEEEEIQRLGFWKLVLAAMQKERRVPHRRLNGKSYQTRPKMGDPPFMDRPEQPRESVANFEMEEIRKQILKLRQAIAKEGRGKMMKDKQ